MPEQNRAAWEVDCFGCTQQESRNGIDAHVASQLTHLGNDVNVALMSILSDAQQLIEIGSNQPAGGCLNRARQYLNRVKDALSSAAPIELWKLDAIRANFEISHECRETIRLAARKMGLD